MITMCICVRVNVVTLILRPKQSLHNATTYEGQIATPQALRQFPSLLPLQMIRSCIHAVDKFYGVIANDGIIYIFTNL